MTSSWSPSPVTSPRQTPFWAMAPLTSSVSRSTKVTDLILPTRSPAHQALSRFNLVLFSFVFSSVFL